MYYIIGLVKPEPRFLRETLSYTKDQIETLRDEASAVQKIFDDIATLTRDRDDIPLRIAHCIRDLAYGKKSRNSDLKTMVQSEFAEYKEIFIRCYWRSSDA